MRARTTNAVFAISAAAALAGCRSFGAETGGSGGGTAYAVADAPAVGDGAGNAAASYATTYYAPQPTGTPVAAQSLAGEGQIAYGPDGSLYRYSNGANGCTLVKYAFGATGSATPLATATGDPHLSGTTKPLGCYGSTTDQSGNVYVLVASGGYLGVDVFDASLAYRYQVGNGRTSGIFYATAGSVPALPLAVDSAGNLYVGQGSSIAIFASTARADAAPSGFLAVPLATVALAFDLQGDLYVANATAVNVYAPLATGGFSLATSVGLVNSFPNLRIVRGNAVAVDSLSNLYVLTASASGATAQVLVFPVTSTTAGTFGNPAAVIPVGAAADSVAVAPPGVAAASAQRRRR